MIVIGVLVSYKGESIFRNAFKITSLKECIQLGSLICMFGYSKSSFSALQGQGQNGYLWAGEIMDLHSEAANDHRHYILMPVDFGNIPWTMCMIVSYSTFFARNVALEDILNEGNAKAPTPLKTGTTIAGVVCKVTLMYFLKICLYLFLTCNK